MADAHTPDRSSDPVYIFTDGCALSMRGPGGYGVLIRDGDSPERSERKGFRFTTKNRMQVMAVLHGLRETAASGADRKTFVRSNSRYVVDSIAEGRLARWERDGWKRSPTLEPVKNVDLWKEMVELMRDRDLSVTWTRVHGRSRESVICDELANVAARLPDADREIDEAFEREPELTPEPASTIAEVSLESDAGSESITIEESPEPERLSDDAGSDDAAPSFTHLDDRGAARMVDVGDKPATVRRATASCRVAMSAPTVEAIRDGGFSKGDVLAVARVAGISAAKRTWELIPMCHQIPLSYVKVALEFVDDAAGSGISVTATAQARAETGVEMEALTAASVAALTIYDMCKSAERGIAIHDLRLLRKTGGASGDYVAE